MNDGGGFIKLRGTAREVGRRLGRLGAGAIADRMALARDAARRSGVGDGELASRAREFASHVERFAPHWLDEAAGVAEGASVATDDILMLNCLPAPVRTPGDECTSFVRVEAGRCILFKIRDYRPCVQVFHVNAGDGRPRLQISTEVGGLGAAHVMSEHALAGACNTGSASAHVTDAPRLNDCHMLRWICERARSAADVPRLAAELIESGSAGGAGGDRGSILLFAAPDGGGVLETVHDDLVWTEISKSTLVASNHFVSERARSWESHPPPDENTLVRKRRMEELLGASDTLDAARVFEVARDRETAPHALCNYDLKHPWMTVSAALHLIDRADPSRSEARLCCGNTRHSFFLPVPVGEARSFAPLAGGEFYGLADARRRAHGPSDLFAPERKRIERDGVSFEQATREAYEVLKRSGV
ncbi:MAG: C45 family autoproteolytic acyltransferase/hydrolase [Planctomycetota bacterium]